MPLPARAEQPIVAPHLELFGDIGFLLARASGITIRSTNARLRPLRLRVRHFSVLSVAVQAGGVSQRELSVLLGLDPSQIVALVDDLERQRLVERRAHGRDRRARIISATPEGESRYQQASEIVNRAREEFLTALDVSDETVLRDLLMRLVSRDMPEVDEQEIIARQRR
jgi:DNA-binding MarR family transcriptional regulator